MPAYTEIGTGIGPAEIVEVNPQEKSVWVRGPGTGDDMSRLAQVAIPWTSALCAGAIGLVAGGEGDLLFLIGLLESPAEVARQQIATSDGVTAIASRTAGSETLQVIGETGELLFEYDATTRRTRIHFQPGHVQFVARHGSIDFVADGDIRLRSCQSVAIEGQLGVRLESGAHGSAGPALALGVIDARLSGPQVRIATPRLDVAALETRFTGRKLLGRIARPRVVVESLEMVVGTLVQKAKNVFRRVSGLEELHAKNARTLIEDNLHVKGGRVSIKADGDVKIDGEQIHLG